MDHVQCSGGTHRISLFQPFQTFDRFAPFQGDQSVPIVPAVQPLRSVQKPYGSSKVQGFNVQ